MMLTFLLARVFGTYLIVAGIAVLARRKFVMSALGGYVDDKFGQLVISFFAVILGLFIVNVHTLWTTLPATLVSLFGWALFLKGVFIMLAPDSLNAKIVKIFSKRAYIVADGLIALLLGAYLSAVGYGLI